MLKAFSQHINTNFPGLKSSKLLLAVSGGLDSMVLLDLCKKLDLDCVIAHCNFKLRGAESDADEQFVIMQSKLRNFKVVTTLFETEQFAKSNKISIQMAARELRYLWFKTQVQELNLNAIVTAHHADDNLETLLINLTRGTGIAGLLGIPEKNEAVVRPLLPFSRGAILNYAKDNKVIWREDVSNSSTKYLRNKLRHDVIPDLKAAVPQVLENIVTTQNNLKETQTLLKDYIGYCESVALSGDITTQIEIDLIKLSQFPNQDKLLFEILKPYGFSAWSDIRKLKDAQSGKFVKSLEYRIIKHTHSLILTKSEPAEHLRYWLSENAPVSIDGIELNLEKVDKVSELDSNSILIDGSSLKLPLEVRKRQNGDYFYPIGMKGKKKISKFYKDLKLSLIDKENAWLVCSGNDVVWVLGHRMDDRFKLKQNSISIYKLSVSQ